MRDRDRYEKRVGSVVDGRWRIDSLLGWGSTSAVYAATHRNGHRAALKILHQSLCSDASIAERFLREAGIANAIKHRAIVPIGDDGMTEDGCAYLVLELLEGETLDEIRERSDGRMALEDFAPIVEELMSAIGAVHAVGVVHRDLKPGNVFVTKDGRLKLLDFGTARIFDRAAGSPLSMQGLVIGTPSFMSPEQARGARGEVDAQSDVWSLGAMIFTVLSGEYVHVGRDAHAQLLAAASKEARSLSSAAPWVDERVAAVVDRALSFSKDERWSDVQAMRVAFRSAVLTSMPTLRDVQAYADAMDAMDAESAASSASLSDPTLVMSRAELAEVHQSDAAPIAAVPAHSENEAPAVSSTQGVRRVSRGIPVPALLAGFGAMAAAAFVVVFFVAGVDASSGSRVGASITPGEGAFGARETTLVSPAPSFMVITAPDDPNAPSAKRKGVAASAAGANGALKTTASTTNANAKTTAASATTERTVATSATSATSAAAGADPDDGDIPGTKANASLGVDAGPAMSATPASVRDGGGKGPAAAPSEPGSGGPTNDEPAPKG